MASDTHDIARDAFMLRGRFARHGYDWWWHSFTGRNAVTGAEKSFFVEFFLINPALGEPDPVLGQLPENQARRKRPSYLMVKCGCWGKGARQLHRFFGWDEAEVGKGAPFYVQADDCLCCETDLIGHVAVSAEAARLHPEWMSDVGEMHFDLHMDKRIAFNVGPGANKPLRDAEAFQMFWHAEGIKTLYTGTVILDGVVYVVESETSYGYADKNWGSDFTSPWVWLASNDLVSQISGRRLQNSALEIGGGRPKIGCIALERKLLGCLNYEGHSFEFNFSKPWTLPHTEFDCFETQGQVVWQVRQDTAEARLVTDISCCKRDMLHISYEAPDGRKRYSHLWNGGTGSGRIQLFCKLPHLSLAASHMLPGHMPAKRQDLELVDDIICGHVGCEYGEYDA